MGRDQELVQAVRNQDTTFLLKILHKSNKSSKTSKYGSLLVHRNLYLNQKPNTSNFDFSGF